MSLPSKDPSIFSVNLKRGQAEINGAVALIELSD
jgi:hypothetical protein